MIPHSIDYQPLTYRQRGADREILFLGPLHTCGRTDPEQLGGPGNDARELGTGAEQHVLSGVLLLHREHPMVFDTQRSYR